MWYSTSYTSPSVNSFVSGVVGLLNTVLHALQGFPLFAFFFMALLLYVFYNLFLYMGWQARRL
jgi:type III secretory pathway component EscS